LTPPPSDHSLGTPGGANPQNPPFASTGCSRQTPGPAPARAPHRRCRGRARSCRGAGSPERTQTARGPDRGRWDNRDPTGREAGVGGMENPNECGVTPLSAGSNRIDHHYPTFHCGGTPQFIMGGGREQLKGEVETVCFKKLSIFVCCGCILLLLTCQSLGGYWRWVDPSRGPCGGAAVVILLRGKEPSTQHWQRTTASNRGVGGCLARTRQWPG
jgi:hypothetical protein